MTVKTDVIVSLLRQANCRPASIEFVAREANVPVSVFNSVLSGLRETGFIETDNEQIELTSNQRVKLAIHAINQGTDIERVCKVLEWKEFENFAATAFEKNHFTVKRNFRFKAGQRRWEIDVLAYSDPIILSVDCKRWRRGWGHSAITKVADTQAQRTEELANNIQYVQRKIKGIEKWKIAKLFPVILSLFPGPIKFYNKVPVVPILQLQSFINEFQGHLTEMANFQAKLGPKLPDYK